MLDGLIMDYPLTLNAILQRAEMLYGPKEVVTRLPDKSIHRYTNREMIPRVKQLALALKKLGVGVGDRVATLGWNHYQHLEAYFGIPACGGVLHTLNPRLHANDLTYIMNHAEDKVLFVDEVLLPVFETFRTRIKPAHVVVMCAKEKPPASMHEYEQLIASTDVSRFRYPELDEKAAAAMCYTSGTTGQPKGVLYSHRAIALHSMAGAMVDTLGLCEADVVLPVVPMFHANAWGTPYTAALVGCKQVFPGCHLDAASLLELLEKERATVTAGVPTVWLAILQALDKEPKRYDLSRLRCMVVGGSAAPLSMIQGFQERHGLKILHAWGMTEMCPMGTLGNLPSTLCDAPKAEQYAYRARQGTPGPFIEIRARGEKGLVPWDGQSVGELEVRGPWVASAYYNCPEGAVSFTDDGWFRTGDIVAIHPNGCIEIQDRAKDVIKSGGEWISSVQLESALMGHPAVLEAAVISVPHPKWAERPLAVVVLREGKTATPQELIDYLTPNFAKWWLPEAVEFVPEIPRTAAGKFLKTALRERFKDYVWPVVATA